MNKNNVKCDNQMRQPGKCRSLTALWVFIFCAGLVLPAGPGAIPALAGDCKVGVIDTAMIVLKSKYGEEIRAGFAEHMEDQRQALEKKRVKAERKKKRLIQAKKDGKSEKALEELKKDLEKDIKELALMKENMDNTLVKMDKTLQTKMKKRVHIVLDQFVAATDYCIVIEKHRVAAFSEKVDVTDVFIKWMDSYKE